MYSMVAWAFLPVISGNKMMSSPDSTTTIDVVRMDGLCCARLMGALAGDPMNPPDHVHHWGSAGDEWEPGGHVIWWDPEARVKFMLEHGRGPGQRIVVAWGEDGTTLRFVNEGARGQAACGELYRASFGRLPDAGRFPG